jgi:NAD(P)-dependent dehydrogenase (short-subunit alcohol dehydrogenase family)
MSQLSGKVALVTGGSKGIGLSIAEFMVNHGMNVVITARNESEVLEAARHLNARGPGRALGVRSDARSFEDQENAVSRAVSEFGKLDVLIANAGVGIFKPVQDLTLEDWHAVIDTNLTGVFYSLKAAVKALEASKGYVITVSSLAGKNPFVNGAAYNASKFGLNGFSEAAMLDLRALGIKLSYIMPGSVATYFNGHTPSEADAWKIQPEDVAQIVIDLLEMNPRTLPSRVEVRPSQPPKR